MKILSDATPWGSPPTPACLAIGVFDGVHRGHAEVARRALATARSVGGRAVAVTFDRHPQAVVAPETAPLLIQPLWRRLDALAELGLDAALVFEFTEAFAAQPATAFVERLTRGFGRVAEICVGTTFVFGHRRSGDLALLEAMSRQHGFRVVGVPPLVENGEAVSSTRVREAVGAGDLDRAAGLLGRPYSLAGEVLTGDRIGRTLGFPTANLDVRGLVLPPIGVYGAWASWPGASRRAAAVNVGRRPTVSGLPGPVRVEAHVIGFEGDLYGRRLELEIGPCLRGEVRFGSRDELTRQIGRDVEAVRGWASGAGK